jgi:hypothetical protein
MPTFFGFVVQSKPLPGDVPKAHRLAVCARGTVVQEVDEILKEILQPSQDKSRTVLLGWEFQFLVLISGTPIGSRVTILFLIPKIPVGKFFSISAVEKLRNQNSDSKIQNSKKNKRRNSIYLILPVMSIV